MWLSRSWTTRARRPGEAESAYRFVTDEEFDAKVSSGGFLEWAEFLGHRYGTPMPDPPPGHDVLLEIDLQGAQQVKAYDPRAVLVLLVPPSAQVQADRLRSRGEDEARIAQRVAMGLEEASRGRLIADDVVVNDDLDQALERVCDILERHRRLVGGSGDRS